MSCSRLFWTRLLCAFLLIVAATLSTLYWVGANLDPVSHLRKQMLRK